MERPRRILTILVLAVLASFASAAPAGAVQVYAAGDIGETTPPGGDQADTAQIIKDLAAAGSYVLPLGDNAYEFATLQNYLDNYDPWWGPFSEFAPSPWGTVIKPVPGNHEYNDPAGNQQGYRTYFGTATHGFQTGGGASDPLWYTYRKAGWRFIALDSEAAMNGGTPASAQYQFVKDTLLANADSCILAYWHKPRFVSTTTVSNYGAAGPVFKLLWQNGTDIVLNGHGHVYERFKKIDYNEADDSDVDGLGIREFVVGTGGAQLMSFGTLQPNSEVQLSAYGVLKLVLTAGTYTWKFVKDDGTVGGAVVDSGSAACNANGG